MPIPRRSTLAAAALVAVPLVAVAACSGPQPLDVAIRPADETRYVDLVVRADETPRAAALPVDDAEAATKNPFSRKDAGVVSRGAVLYKYNCARCHGADARGHGNDLPEGQSLTDFHSFGQRFASTIHGGAPTRWFRVIHDGVPVPADEAMTRVEMPAFGATMTRQQIWEVITYLQSLDMHASAD